ncbi:hypothetical protein ABTX60_07435 [Streptomyces sp. NPDC126510]|uniref:hypothetical protein n=1 Tax=Streptomyces sp. NPDC126510 TaxID=3155317 RepID=UPI003317F536
MTIRYPAQQRTCRRAAAGFLDLSLDAHPESGLRVCAVGSTLPHKDVMMNGSSQYVLNGADRGRQELAQRWLLQAAPEEQVALNEWSCGVALLVAGRTWDAVRVPYEVLDTSFDADTAPKALRTCVADLRLVGPSFCDPYRPYVYFLVQAGTDRVWPAEEFESVKVECLGGTEPYVRHIGVPPIGRTERPGLFWLMPPDRVACRHVDAAHLLNVLRERLRQSLTEPAHGGVR